MLTWSSSSMLAVAVVWRADSPTGGIVMVNAEMDYVVVLVAVEDF